MIINLGDLALNYKRESIKWIMDIQRYKWMRFFGLSTKRFFLGLIVTSSDGPANPDEYHKHRVEFFTHQLEWAKRDLAEQQRRRDAEIE